MECPAHAKVKQLHTTRIWKFRKRGRKRALIADNSISINLYARTNQQPKDEETLQYTNKKQIKMQKNPKIEINRTCVVNTMKSAQTKLRVCL